MYILVHAWGIPKAWSVVYVSAILLYVCKKERLQWHQLVSE